MKGNPESHQNRIAEGEGSVVFPFPERTGYPQVWHQSWRTVLQAWAIEVGCCGTRQLPRAVFRLTILDHINTSRCLQTRGLITPTGGSNLGVSQSYRTQNASCFCPSRAADFSEFLLAYCADAGRKAASQPPDTGHENSMSLYPLERPTIRCSTNE